MAEHLYIDVKLWSGRFRITSSTFATPNGEVDIDEIERIEERRRSAVSHLLWLLFVWPWGLFLLVERFIFKPRQLIIHTKDEFVHRQWLYAGERPAILNALEAALAEKNDKGYLAKRDIPPEAGNIDKWYYVSIPYGRDTLRFPHRCVCCGGAAEMERVISLERGSGWPRRFFRSQGWTFPFCRNCDRHWILNLRWRQVVYWAVWPLIPALGNLIALAEGGDNASLNVGLTSMGIAVAMVALAMCLRFRARNLINPECPSVGCPVDVYWQKDEVIVRTGKDSGISFRNREYAYDFASANGFEVIVEWEKRYSEAGGSREERG